MPLPHPLRPTGTCFDDALDFVAGMVGASSEANKQAWMQSLVIVHAICLAPNGEKYAHAWVEHLDEQVWQAGLVEGGYRVFYAQPLTSYYAERRILDWKRYTVAEALQLNEQHNHFGPWEQRYRAFTLPRV